MLCKSILFKIIGSLKQNQDSFVLLTFRKQQCFYTKAYVMLMITTLSPYEHENLMLMKKREKKISVVQGHKRVQDDMLTSCLSNIAIICPIDPCLNFKV